MNNDGKWKHVLRYYDAPRGPMYIYIDGELVHPLTRWQKLKRWVRRLLRIKRKEWFQFKGGK